MTKTLLVSALLALAMFAAGSAHADEAAFLRSLDGNWVGRGSVKVRTSAPRITVSCKFTSRSTANSLALEGNCRGLLVFSRRIAIRLKTRGGTYSGTYIGAGTGPATLRGNRSGNALNLTIRWAKNVNGDRTAMLTLQKSATNRTQISTTDKDRKTGNSVVTSRINLQRN